jgi:hypothetical protein
MEVNARHAATEAIETRPDAAKIIPAALFNKIFLDLFSLKKSRFLRKI